MWFENTIVILIIANLLVFWTVFLSKELNVLNKIKQQPPYVWIYLDEKFTVKPVNSLPSTWCDLNKVCIILSSNTWWNLQDWDSLKDINKIQELEWYKYSYIWTNGYVFRKK